MAGAAIFVGAHPDDIELGCAGAIQKHVESGDAVFAIVATDGALAVAEGGVEERHAEQLAALNLLSVSVLKTLNLPDGCANAAVISSAVKALIEETGAGWLYYHAREDAHRDHVAVWEGCRHLARHVDRALVYESPSSIDFTPNYYVRMSAEEMAVKTQSVRLHRSQIERLSTGKRLDDWAEAVARFRGTQINERYAEGFRVEKYVIGESE